MDPDAFKAKADAKGLEVVNCGRDGTFCEPALRCSKGGCMDSTSDNYDPMATVNTNSCSTQYPHSAERIRCLERAVM